MVLSPTKSKEFIGYLEKRARPNTVSAYVTQLDAWARWLNARNAQFSPESAQDYLDELEAKGKSPNTINVVANAIRKWYRWQRLPITLDTPSIHISEPKYVVMDELTSILATCETVLEQTVVIVLFDTGIRISELLNLRVSQIDWKGKFIHVTRKGGREENVNISDKGLSIIKKWLNVRRDNSEMLLMDWDYQDVYSLTRRVGNRVGIHLTPHMLRHSRAVQMLDVGTDMHIVQQHLGHTNIGSTMNVYARLKPVNLKEKIPAW